MGIWPGLPVLVYPNVLSTILYQILFTLLNVDYATYVYNRHCSSVCGQSSVISPYNKFATDVDVYYNFYITFNRVQIVNFKHNDSQLLPGHKNIVRPNSFYHRKLNTY